MIKDPDTFELSTSHTPKGDQPTAIAKLVEGLNDGLAFQTLLGATGTGKTFTMANVIQKTNRPALIIAPNKTLCAQLYSEMKAFFPNAAVEYFVSYFDYFQPETYIPSIDRYIDKDSLVNEHLQMLRLSATKSILTRQDTIIVSTVSAIFGLGESYEFESAAMLIHQGGSFPMDQLTKDLVHAQYENVDKDKLLRPGQFKKLGDTMIVFPAENSEDAVRISFFGDEVDALSLIDPITGMVKQKLGQFLFFPATHYVVDPSKVSPALDLIRAELKERVEHFQAQGKHLEARRLKEKVDFDLEMLVATGYCRGIENYSRHFTGRDEGVPPPTLLDYLPEDGLVFIDESHTTIPQLTGMYAGDKSRKDNLVDFGFRMPSAMDARPLKFSEVEERLRQTIFVSATPGPYELAKSGTDIAEQIIRPTGVVDPEIEVRPASTQVDDCMSEITDRVKAGERVLITVLSKKMAEQLADYYNDHGFKARFLHGDVEAVERVEILRDLRLGKFDVLVGVNLLREGLDLPEVSLVAVMDADKEGFLRNARSLIQTVGRAARNVRGHAIFYAEKTTMSMKAAIDETNRRRAIQLTYNKKHKITPINVANRIRAMLDQEDPVAEVLDELEGTDVVISMKDLEKKMKEAAKNLEFEKAAKYRDQISALRKRSIGHE